MFTNSPPGGLPWPVRINFRNNVAQISEQYPGHEIVSHQDLPLSPKYKTNYVVWCSALRLVAPLDSKQGSKVNRFSGAPTNCCKNEDFILFVINQPTKGGVVKWHILDYKIHHRLYYNINTINNHNQ